MKLYNLIILLALGFFISSCAGDDEAPTITLLTPLDGSSVSPGDNIDIWGRVMDNEGIDNIVLSAGTFTETITSFDTDISHVLNTTLVLDSMATAGTFNVSITATDINENTATESVSVTVN